MLYAIGNVSDMMSRGLIIEWGTAWYCISIAAALLCDSMPVKLERARDASSRT